MFFFLNGSLQDFPVLRGVSVFILPDLCVVHVKKINQIWEHPVSSRTGEIAKIKEENNRNEWNRFVKIKKHSKSEGECLDIKNQRLFRRAVTVWLLSLVLVCGFPVPPAFSEEEPMAPVSTKPFVLTRTATNLPGEVSKLEGELQKSGIQKLLDEANREATRGCSSPALNQVSGVLDNWCFNSGDNQTSEWYPQGVTGTGDAQADDYWGSKQAVLVSWYHSQKGVRISFLDTDTGKYRHVLLVEPYTNSYGNPSYRAVKIHAGGIVWYGNYLYVMDTKKGFRVFDMRYVFDLGASSNGNTSNKDLIGRQNGVYYGHGYRYVMPQVGAWTVSGDQTGDTCEPSGPPRFSFVGLDRSTVPDSLITGEYCNPPNPEEDRTLYGRVARWPLDASTGQLKTAEDGKVYASEAYRLPKAHAQGALALNGNWYVMTSAGETSNGKLYKGTPGNVPSSRVAGIGPEDLYYWPKRDQIWTVTEHPGKRVLYAVRP
jgi:hypothetical protein